MTLEEFQSFVSGHDEWFRGVHPESEATLARAERLLKCPLPESMKWLLRARGYSGACGIGSLDDAVAATLGCRSAFGLPERYVVLNDWGDGGVVWLDVTTGAITWGDGADLHLLAAGSAPPAGNSVFSNYPAWASARLEVERGEE